MAAKNVDVDETTVDLMCFEPINTVVDEDESVNFPLDVPGLPPHILRFKIGFPFILQRNLNPLQLSNGEHVVIKEITHWEV